MPDSSVEFLVYNFHSLPVYDVVFSCRMSGRADLLMVDINLFSAPCVFIFFRVVYVLSVFLQSCI